MDEIEIEAFRADTKASKGLTAAHIAAAANAYDADKNPAPLVFGHPSSDSPAHGLISGARAEGVKLFLRLKNVADEVVTGVRERRILNRSIAFWSPDHPSNPTPGVYAIRHLGLLGGQAPAIPNLPALKFSADDSTLESDEAPEAAVVFEVEDAPTPVVTVREPAPTEEAETMKTPEQIAADLQAREEAIAARETAAAKRDQEFAASETLRRETENSVALDAAVAAGKVLPAEKDDLAKIFNALPVTALTFAAGELEPRKALASFLDALPKRAPVGDKPASPTNEFAAGDGSARDRAEKALADANAAQAVAYKKPAA